MRKCIRTAAALLLALALAAGLFGSDSWCKSRYSAAQYGCGEYSRRRCRAGRVYGAY